MITRRLLLLSMVLLTGSALGCKGEKPKRGAGMKIGLALADASSPYDQGIRAGAESLAEDQGFELLIEDAKGSADEQAAALTRLQQNGAGAILVRPVDPAKLSAAAQKVREADTYLVTLDRNIPGADVSTFIEPNRELAGQLCAEYLGQQLKSVGRVAILNPHRETAELVSAFRERLNRNTPPCRSPWKPPIRRRPSRRTRRRSSRRATRPRWRWWRRSGRRAANASW
jgi:ABC-type sugar transport system substrate-binding protein